MGEEEEMRPVSVKKTHQKKLVSNVRMLRKELDRAQKDNEELRSALANHCWMSQTRDISTRQGIKNLSTIISSVLTYKDRLPKTPPSGEGQYAYLLECIDAEMRHTAYQLSQVVETIQGEARLNGTEKG